MLLAQNYDGGGILTVGAAAVTPLNCLKHSDPL